MKKIISNKYIKLVVILLFTSLLRAVAVTVFFLPNSIANGGASGIATILAIHIPSLALRQGLIAFVINIPLLLMAFIYLNRRFVFMTLIATGLTSAITELLFFISKTKDIFFTSNPFVATLAGGILWGVALGFLLKANCSTGGSDIVGLLIQNKFPQAKVVWLIFIIDCIIGVVGGIVAKNNKIATMIYSVVAVYAASFIADLMQRGFIATVEFKIITNKEQEIAEFIIQELHRSITAFKATGMFTRSDKYFLICVVRRRQLQLVKKRIKEIDPQAFFYITGVSDISGNGFDNTLTPSSKIK